MDLFYSNYKYINVFYKAIWQFNSLNDNDIQALMSRKQKACK